MPRLQGERVFLRAARRGDHEEWRALRAANHAYLRPFEPRWGDADLDRAAFLGRMAQGRRDARAGTDFGFLIFERRGAAAVLVGGVTLSNIRRRISESATLGYWLGEDFAGRGLMTEAVGEVVRFAFGPLGLHRVHAATLPHNRASRRVLEKNGFREEGFAEGYLLIDGRWADHLLFGLTRERWEGHAGARAP